MTKKYLNIKNPNVGVDYINWSNSLQLSSPIMEQVRMSDTHVARF